MNSHDNHPTPIALVTGGSRGIGRNIALRLGERGSDVIITFNSREDAAREVVDQLTAMGRKAIALRLDVADSSSFGAFAETVQAKLREVWKRDRLDHLVNNAGDGLHASFVDTTEAQFDRIVDVHLKSVFFLTQRLLPLLADGGRILNISSGLTQRTSAFHAAYPAVKGAVEVLTRYLATQLAPRGIRVNVVAPGAIATDFAGGAVRDNPQLNKNIAAMTPLGRVGLPDDIGDAVAMLLSPGFGWMTGERIGLAGGMGL